jgi:hypothetical protein
LVSIWFIITKSDIKTYPDPFNIDYAFQAPFLNSTKTGSVEPLPISNKGRKISPWSWKFENDRCYNETTQYFKHGFTKFNDDQISHFQNSWKTFINNLQESPKFKGRGIVYTSYPDVLKETKRSIQFIRHWGCKLPIEVFHCDGELSAENIKELEAYQNVKVYDLAVFAKNDGHRFSFERKNPQDRLFQVKGGALI